MLRLRRHSISSALAAMATAPSSVALPPMKPEACTNTPPGTPLAALQAGGGRQEGQVGSSALGHGWVANLSLLGPPLGSPELRVAQPPPGRRQRLA